MHLRLGRASAVAAILLSTCLQGSATAAPTIAEFPLPSGLSGPQQVTGGPNQTLWFTEAGANGLGISTVNGSISQWSGLHGPAEGITLGPDGNLWMAEPTAGYIARLTPAKVLTEFAVPSVSVPWDIAAGPDGALWFTERLVPAIGRITTGGTITQYTTGLSKLSLPSAITAGPDGNLWFAEPGIPAIGRITPQGTITQYTAGLGQSSEPTSIAAGPDGNVWFTLSGAHSAIGRITPQGTITEYTAGLTAGSNPSSIVAGPDHNLWFTEAANPGRIGTITTAGAITELATPTVNSQPGSIAAGPDGNMWFLEDGAHGQLGSVALTAGGGSGSGAGGSGGSGGGTNDSAPAAFTGAATAIGETSATLNAGIDPEGTATTYHFNWGWTTTYGQQAPATDATAGAAATPHAVSQALTGLTPDTVYHYRVVAASAAGTTTGADMTFVTASAPTLTIGSGNPVGAAAPPAISHTAVAGVLSGTVLVRVPGSPKLQPLSASSDVPLGSLIDASRGVIHVTTALNAHGKTQTATVWGGQFVIGQTGRQGMTTLTLPAASCTTHRSYAPLEVGTALATQGSPTHSLWAHDDHGQYTTRGQNSVATVRGTVWETVNTCAGTRTFVKKGLVSVRNVHSHRTILVSAGHSYLARP